MKLSLVLSAILFSSAVIINGCGSSSSSSDNNTSSSVESSNSSASSSVPANGPEFTVAMLAGNTFYGYGIHPEEAGFEAENRMVAEFDANASSVHVHNHADSNESFSVDAANSIVDGKMEWQIDGMSGITGSALKIYEDGSFMMTIVDLDHYDPYPVYFATTELADKGQSVFEAFADEQTISKDALTANGWYDVEWMDGLECVGLIMANADNMVDLSYVDENGTLQSLENIATYVVSDNKMETVDEDAEHNTWIPVLASEDSILWQREAAFFKNRADAVKMVQLMGGGEECYDKFPQ